MFTFQPLIQMWCFTVIAVVENEELERRDYVLVVVESNDAECQEALGKA